MTKKMWKTVPVLAALALALIAAGCATRVPLTVSRQPNLDTRGIQRVTVAPFQAGAGTAQIAQQLTSEITGRLQATGAFTLVSHDMVRNAQARGESIEPYVDAVFRGRITHYAGRTTSGQGVRRVRRDGAWVNEPYTFIQREVEVSFEYYFMRARDGSMVGPVRRTGRNSNRAFDGAQPPGYMELAMGIVRGQLGLFYRDVAPHTIRVTRVMPRESDSNVRRLMNDNARARMRNGDYLGAREAYRAIWESHRSIAAAISAAILYEATGDLEDGIFFMEQVFEVTRSPQINQKLALLNREAAEILGLEAFGDVQAPAERIATHAVGEISGVLPPTPRLWIHSTVDLPLVNDVIDNMVSMFLVSGFTVVDRQMINLVLAEQNRQLDGSIADSDFISIGNLAGANTVVVVNVIGTGAARRLQVR
ncbi:MAG: hypothetical protein FWD88_07860, partial [Treponema sp.]|nr:hypothetical protein [Treponema sp.]